MAGDDYIRPTREFLVGAVPGLEAALEPPNKIQAAFLIRSYISRISNLGSPATLLDHERWGRFGHGSKVLEDLLEFRGGVWCGGASALFVAFLKAIGIGACQYAYGWPDGLSHVTTLFASPPRTGETKREDFYLLDNYLGYHYTDPEGNLLTLIDVLGYVVKQQHQRIVVHHVDLARPYLSSPGADISEMAWLFPGEQIPEPDKRADVWIYPGAIMNLDKLYAFTSPSRHLADQRRGEQPLDEFALDMLLINPHLGGIESKFEPCHDDYRMLEKIFLDHGRKS